MGVLNNCIVAVAYGDSHIRQGEAMIASFQHFHPDWQVRRFYNQDIDALLPEFTRDWNGFSKSEIGRFAALHAALTEGFDRALYCDNDIYFYDLYTSTVNAPIILTPHCITPAASRARFHWMWHDGVPNNGMIEVRKPAEADLKMFIDYVLSNPGRYFRKEGLWLQNVTGVFAQSGFGAEYNLNPGVNVGRWNLRFGRSVFERHGKYYVLLDGQPWSLICMHFSRWDRMLGKYGDAVTALVEQYSHIIS